MNCNLLKFFSINWRKKEYQACSKPRMAVSCCCRSGCCPAAEGKRILTQEQFAEYLEIGQNSLSRMEKGVIAPEFSRLPKIACTVAELFFLPSEPTCLHARLIKEKITTLLENLQEIALELVEQIVLSLKKVP